MGFNKNYKNIVRSMNLLIEEFEDGEFTTKEAKSLLKVGIFASFDCIKDNGLVEVVRVEYYDLPSVIVPTDYEVTLSTGMKITVSETEGKNLLLNKKGMVCGLPVINVEQHSPQGVRFYYAVNKNWKDKMLKEISADEIKARKRLDEAMQKVDYLTRAQEHLQNMFLELSA